MSNPERCPRENPNTLTGSAICRNCGKFVEVVPTGEHDSQPVAADPIAPLVQAFKKLQQHFHLAHSTSIMISPLSKCQNQVCVDGCAALAAYEGRQK